MSYSMQCVNLYDDVKPKLEQLSKLMSENGDTDRAEHVERSLDQLATAFIFKPFPFGEVKNTKVSMLL